MEKACIACNLQGGFDDLFTSLKMKHVFAGCSEAFLASSQAVLRKMAVGDMRMVVITAKCGKKPDLLKSNVLCNPQPLFLEELSERSTFSSGF